MSKIQKQIKILSAQKVNGFRHHVYINPSRTIFTPWTLDKYGVQAEGRGGVASLMLLQHS